VHLLTGHMITAGILDDVDTTPWAGTRTRKFLDGLERLFFILIATFGAFGFSLIVVACLFLVEWHFADEAIAGLAHLTGENVAVVFGEVGS
jgi:hypothetical protein